MAKKILVDENDKKTVKGNLKNKIIKETIFLKKKLGDVDESLRTVGNVMVEIINEMLGDNFLKKHINKEENVDVLIVSGITPQSNLPQWPPKDEDVPKDGYSL